MLGFDLWCCLSWLFVFLCVVLSWSVVLCVSLSFSVVVCGCVWLCVVVGGGVWLCMIECVGGRVMVAYGCHGQTCGSVGRLWMS